MYESLIERLLHLEHPADQRNLLQVHMADLNDQLLCEMKARADHLMRADVDTCLRLVQAMHVAATLSQAPTHRALALLAEANIDHKLARYGEAVAHYDEAAEIYHSLQRVVDEAAAQIGKITSLRNQGRYSEALATGERAAAVLEAHADWLRLGRLQANMGTIYGRLGDDYRALELFNRARAFYENSGPEGARSIPVIEVNRSITLRNLGDYAASMAAGQKAQQLFAQSGQKIEEARARQSLAITQFVLGRYNTSLELFDQVREVFLAEGLQRDAVLVDLFMSDCLLQLGRLEDVLDKAQEIRRIFTELGTKLEIGQSILNEAVVYTRQGTMDEALQAFAEARQIFVDEGIRPWVAVVELEMADLLFRQNRYSESLAHLEVAAQILEKRLPTRYAQVQWMAARALCAMGCMAEAQVRATEALHITEELDLPWLAYQIHHLLGATARAGGDRVAALAALTQSVDILEQLRGQVMVEFRADFLSGKQGPYDDLMRLYLDLEEPQAAFETVERAKSRALVDLLAYRIDISLHAREPADQPVVDEILRLRQ
ncbi:MAG: tetratricopeptide repeat protein, partial [Chloroflexi bacterium]|nr:tetratricopeptide repeat protein [Chloroflexota bacterium]